MNRTRYWSKAKRERHHANAVRRGKASAAARAKLRTPIGDQEPRRRDPGVWIGQLEWREADGRVRRWTVRQGRRKNRIEVAGVEHGWDWLFTTLRGKLAPLTR